MNTAEERDKLTRRGLRLEYAGMAVERRPPDLLATI